MQSIGMVGTCRVSKKNTTDQLVILYLFIIYSIQIKMKYFSILA